jgi:hypothetical protein
MTPSKRPTAIIPRLYQLRITEKPWNRFNTFST